MDSPARTADARSDQAIASADVADPRPYYRRRLKTLRDRDPDAFARAVAHYESTVVPRIAAAGTDPVEEWFGYGAFLARLDGSGRFVAIDRTGRSAPATEPWPRDRLVLFLPDDAQARASVIVVPREPSPAQSATIELLVDGRLD